MPKRTINRNVWVAVFGRDVVAVGPDYPDQDHEYYGGFTAKVDPRRAKSSGDYRPYKGNTDWVRAANYELGLIAKVKRVRRRQS